ncbi:hypothetical protein R1sor_018949 [Riccia sorocarpa]|uniref:Crossover junction endonuclease MUS81 n=1 Tax=Riccia sorocarpa TaxID=122646 RepID=A0ABD3IDW3_9MARC
MPPQSRSVVCHENRFLADWFFRKLLELDIAEKPSKSLEETMKKAFVKVCDHPTHIQNLYDAKQVKGIGTWLLQKLKNEFFESESPTGEDPLSQASNGAGNQQNETSGLQGKKGRGKKRYLPGKNTAGYALLITLFRAHRDGKEFMKKQELIDAAELTGLSRAPIMPTKPSIWSQQPRSGSGFYSGWNGMTTLIKHALVVKCSNPAKYKLTEEGMIAAQECIERAGLEGSTGRDQGTQSDDDCGMADGREVHEGSPSDGEDEPGFGVNIERTSSYVCYSSSRQREYLGSSQPASLHPDLSRSSRQNQTFEQPSSRNGPTVNMTRADTAAAPLRVCDRVAPDRTTSQSFPQPPLNASQERISPFIGSSELNDDLAVPPLRTGERFNDIYDVICILDRREQFSRGSNGSQLQKFAERLETQYQLKVETRQIPVGDAIWVARHKQTSEEYVLDFVIERKAVDDLWQSIKDHRYKNQKLRLLNSGLKRLIYLVEGDVNMIDSTGSCKTAYESFWIFSTEIADGFHVLRTSDTSDTLKQYGNLTFAIKNRYRMEVGKRGEQLNCCRTYSKFLEHCKDLDRDRVTDIFCLQLMQINHVTEDIALSIQDRYPTVYSLVQAYRNLEGNVGAQEKLLQGIPIRGSSRTLTALLSKNIYKLIWSP